MAPAVVSAVPAAVVLVVAPVVSEVTGVPFQVLAVEVQVLLESAVEQEVEGPAWLVWEEEEAPHRLEP